MATDPEKNEIVSHFEDNEARVSSQGKESLVEGEEEGKVTLKIKLAVLSLIFMYEAYLFTLIM